MIFLILLSIAVVVLMPLAFAVRLWRLRETSLAGWLLVTADAAVFVALVLLVARWDMAGIYTRYLLGGVFTVALLASWRKHARLPWRAATPILRTHWTTVLSLLLFSAALAYVCVGIFAVRNPHPLAFPLEHGRFVVAQGGGIGLLNHHAGHRAQRYAADITAVGPAGFRADGILPDDPRRYAIFGIAVVAPCDGAVTAAVDGLPDLPPPEMDPDNAAGNHVVLSCAGLSVELAHLRNGSVAVRQGDTVSAGQKLGEVGNSGNTTEPHLHIHAVDRATGEGMPVSFDGAAPVRNRIYVR